MKTMSYISNSVTTGDNQHPLEAFFGPYRGSRESMRADDQLAHETYNLPKAYEGKNRFLEEVLEFKIRDESDFYTSKLLPWQLSDDIHIKWDIFTFNRSIADIEPEQGVPRFVSAESESHSDTLIRRGLAFMVEHGFYKTERGKRHFNMNLAQISDAVKTTCYFGVIHALLEGQAYYRDWNRRYGRQISRQADLMSMERRRWAIVQKTVNGLYLLDAEIKHEMKREGQTPNMWVFPDKMKIYVNLVGEHQLDYDKRGPEANTNRERGELKTTFRGLPVFEAQSFDIDFSNRPLDLMVRERQCGEFFTLTKAESEKYIYDADTDNWAKLEWSVLEGKAINKGDEPVTNSNGVTNEAVGGGTDNDLLIFRPHQTYRMASAILAQGGNSLGNTFHGHHDFLLSDDATRKIHLGHYTFYSKSVVKNPKGYCLVEDCFAQGYVGGEGTEAFANAQAYKDARNEGTLGREGPSLIVVKTKDVSKVKNCIDLTGRFHQSLYERFNGNYTDINKAHYAGADVVYDLLELRDTDMIRQTDNDEFLNRIQRINTVCYRGCEGKNDGGKFVITQLNQGHWGPNVYPGVKRVREGENSFMRDCQYQVGLK